MREFDVVVVGAGPGGCSFATLAARAGLSVLVLERAAGPEFKIGESLLPEGVRLCRELGLGAELERRGFLPKLGARFVLAEDGSTDRFVFADALRAKRESQAYQVQRIEFDDMLQRHAAASGARVEFERRVTDFELGEERCELGVDGGERIAARFAVDATGPAHLFAKRLGWAEPYPGLRKVALFAHCAGIPRDDGELGGDIQVLWSEQGWLWVIPFADGTTSVGAVGDPDRVLAHGADDQERFDALCRQSAVHSGLLGGRRQLMAVQRRADYSYRCRDVIGGAFALVGDAAGFIDPIFSSGVCLAQIGAFQLADAVLPALVAGETPAATAQERYRAAMGVAVARFLALVRQFYDSRFIERVVSSRRRDNVRRALTSLLAGDVFDDQNPLIRMGVY